jgi:hypothetical protein
MTTVVIIVVVAGVAALVVWGVATRERREPDDRPFDLGEVETATTPEFSLGSGPPDEDRPPRTSSLVRVAVLVTALSGLTAALAWAVGVFIKGRLDDYLR